MTFLHPHLGNWKRVQFVADEDDTMVERSRWRFKDDGDAIMVIQWWWFKDGNAMMMIIWWWIIKKKWENLNPIPIYDFGQRTKT